MAVVFFYSFKFLSLIHHTRIHMCLFRNGKARFDKQKVILH